MSCRFGYLWAVHSLYYWWRDQGLAEHGSLQSEHNPCYLNRMDPTEVAVGWGKHTLEVLRAFINRYCCWQCTCYLHSWDACERSLALPASNLCDVSFR